jgi:DNA-directed RNA polymerase specialized sigma24 family protein
MLMTEFNLETAQQVWKMEAFAEGKLESALLLVKDGFTPERAAELLGVPLDELKTRCRMKDN